MARPDSTNDLILYGDQDFLLPSHMNAGRFILERLLDYKDKLAMINGLTGETITFSEMAGQIVNTAAFLSRIGVKRGVVIAIFSENRIEFMVTTIAAMCAGAVVTFLNPAYSQDELMHAMNISKPQYMFISPGVFTKHFNFLKTMKFIKMFIGYGNKTLHERIMSFKHIVNSSTDTKSYKSENFFGKPETAIILYSSGTTGLPKGAKWSHLNLITVWNQQQICSRDLSMFIMAPWCTCMGLICTNDALTYGNTVIFLPQFEEKMYLETIHKYKPGILLVAPPLVVILSKSPLLDKYDVSSVELIYSGGAPLDEKVINQVKKRLPNLQQVLQGYGMTEGTGALTKGIETVNKEGSVGKVVSGAIIKVEDIESGKKLGPNKPGEICLKGPILFEGYIGKNIELDAEGFYRTGDIAYYDEDGFFYIIDRIKELIKYKGWQVAPSELEAILHEHPSVKDVGVVGKPDKLTGELPVAFIVKQENAQVTEKEIKEFVAKKISPWKQIREVNFVKEIPKNGSGKILRRILKDMLKTSQSKL